MTDESEENLESPFGNDFEENPAVFRQQADAEEEGQKELLIVRSEM